MAETTNRHLAVDGAKPAPTPEELLEIETLLGVSLPPDFVEFLNVANGGYIPYGITIGNESISFCSIYQSGVDVQGGYGFGTFVGEIISARDYLSIPNAVLPFAEDGGGSCVFLDLSSEGKGSVIAFVHGKPEWAGGDNQDKFVEIAKSFDEYVEQLFRCDEDYI